MNYARRKKRVGKGFLPSNRNQRDNEHNGLDLREDLEIPLNTKLDIDDAFSLLDDVAIYAHDELTIAQKFIDHWRGPGRRKWSGLAYPFPDGHIGVIYNSSHTDRRIRITLMEELFHIRLGHRPSRVRFTSVGERSHHKHTESEAYGSAAAALVPYKSLKRMVEERQNSSQIADNFYVSPELVMFRIKVTMLYKKYQKLCT